jgi:hypothetical protein
MILKKYILLSVAMATRTLQGMDFFEQFLKSFKPGTFNNIGLWI